MPEDFQPENPGEPPALSGSPGPAQIPPEAAQTEDLVLSQLNHRDLQAAVIEQISQNAASMKSRKVRLAIAAHPQAPRRIALRVVRELHTFRTDAIRPDSRGSRRFAPRSRRTSGGPGR